MYASDSDWKVPENSVEANEFPTAWIGLNNANEFPTAWIGLNNDCSRGPWNHEDYTKEVKDFGIELKVCWFFLTVACLLFISFTAVYIIMIYKSKLDPDFYKEQRHKYARIKLYFGFACSMLQDIPITCLAVDLYVTRSGSKGLLCWQCAQDKSCTTKYVLRERITRMTALLSVSLLTTAITSAYKGVTTFYRWSRVREAKCFELRACVSLFVGCIYALIIITPSLALVKYKFFSLASQSGNVFAGTVDSLFMIGIICWAVFVVVAFCCPIVQSIRT
ncbi:uncharacterized protein LOC116288050 [Actinia tenebrosa]|uniref:Uncharacterized protein LOC116288050 n=1 Tax=Actinia tenebrosa TaxID=6105 RepID=A0A6P8H2J6_ACTTE|nr:uncharacterized protein LOC116288050 [Actinia tenebrosa]